MRFVLPAPRFWIAGFSAALVLTVAIADFGRESPGPLAAVHAGETGECADCHGGWFESMAEACLDCHRPVAEQIEAKAGLHGRIEDALTCALCHGEHHGEFNLDRVVRDDGIAVASSNHALLRPGEGPLLRDGADYPLIAGPLGARIVNRLVDPATGIILDTWIDADGVMHGPPANFQNAKSK